MMDYVVAIISSAFDQSSNVMIRAAALEEHWKRQWTCYYD